MANVLYIGNSATSSTSSHRFAAIKRLGHSVTMVDLFHAFTNILNSRWIGRIHYRTGYRLLQDQIAKWLSQHTRGLWS